MTEFFGCRLDEVDGPLLNIYQRYGGLPWLKSCQSIERLPQYNSNIRENDFSVRVKQYQSWKTIYWLVDNGIEWSWEHKGLYCYFYVGNDQDWVLTRLFN